MKLIMWRILVPAYGRQESFSYEHYKAWVNYVHSIAGGFTVSQGVKGQWTSPDGIIFRDRMIPVDILCSRKQIKKIIDFTLVHYKQKAVLAYKISEEAIIRYSEEVPVEPVAVVKPLLLHDYSYQFAPGWYKCNLCGHEVHYKNYNYVYPERCPGPE
ncbi:MAG: hypothetical protein A2381_15220 [Bdellovibrionales bacterium RIFOXYB1_FULL_37_110]|nr:MAG: hypothetical protein A2381_15220 [Bdellovibrionales bacterium RIFOXYB1_FULL_37_110]